MLWSLSPKADTELSELRERLLLMAGRVEEMIRRSWRAFEERDRTLARETIDLDGRVNLDEIEIDELCQRLLSRLKIRDEDLRFLTMALKMVVDLERIGDLAVNVCERTLDLGDGSQARYYDELPRMAVLVESMVRDAIDAFVEADAERAWAVIARDDEVDDLYQQAFRTVLAGMLDGSCPIEEGIRQQSAAKFLERMADHSTNVAEHVIFMIEGKDIRHTGKLVPR